ncbi:MAG TPA: dihydroneopterin aldolase [Cyclobacteriaceae bacterium]|nr:dihydroneopterin aldolase [Cyclobacteriaceae bacterium]
MNGRIALEGLEFHAFHGVYPHERESGNWFEVDVTVDTDFSQAASTDELDGTVDYEAIYKAVKTEMDKPSKLLETVGKNIVEEILAQFASVTRVELKISKINPPIGGKAKKATVFMSKKR